MARRAGALRDRRNEYRHDSREALLDRLATERARDFADWPNILHDYIEGLAEDARISREDAMALAIHTSEGIAEMREWALAHAPADEVGAASPAAVVALIERRYPGGSAGWWYRPRPADGSRVRRLARVVRGAFRRVLR